MRTVKVINANKGIVEVVETGATTWGELKSEISRFFSGNVKAVVRETEQTLESDGALLPEGSLNDNDWDFTLFIVTKESKAGADEYDDRDVWTFHDLRREVARRGMNNNEKSRSQLIADLRRTDRSSSAPASTSTLEQKIDALTEKVQFIVDALEVAYSEVDDSNEMTAEEAEDFERISRSV